MEFVKTLRRSLRTRRLQSALDDAPLVLYYNVTNLTAASHTNLKRLLFKYGLECHLMCKNKCLPIHEDDKAQFEGTFDSAPQKKENTKGK